MCPRHRPIRLPCRRPRKAVAKKLGPDPKLAHAIEQCIHYRHVFDDDCVVDIPWERGAKHRIWRNRVVMLCGRGCGTLRYQVCDDNMDIIYTDYEHISEYKAALEHKPQTFAESRLLRLRAIRKQYRERRHDGVERVPSASRRNLRVVS